ncbi:uncharacterized protein [Amphiura filiformis]|uniref:uncharacterized protein n=1 Tax=Amphiura filiformis TaxID=82378 RepID=UPI003B21B5EB
MSDKRKGTRKTRSTSSQSTSDTPVQPVHQRTPTMSMLSPPKHGDSAGTSPSFAEMLGAMPKLSPVGLPADMTPKQLQEHVQNSIKEFQSHVKLTLDGLFKGMQKLESELNRSIEFQSSRIDAMEAKLNPLEEENAKLREQVDSLTGKVQHHADLINKQERFSRRNNIRVVGVPATENESCIDFVEKMLKEQFKMDDVTVERAHRDGRGYLGKSPHLLVKLLSYRDKIEIMQDAKSALKNESYFIVDDLTKADLAEKKKWGQRVKELYNEGTKLKFFAGKWRRNGQPYFTE